MNQSRKWALAALISGAVLMTFTILLTSQKGVTDRELQFIFFATGLSFSFYFGMRSIAEAAQEVLRPHGKKAVRRIVNLAQGITSFITVLNEQRSLLATQAQANSNQVSFAQVELIFDTLEIVAGLQLRTAVDAIEDWGDVMPDVVEALRNNPEGGGK